MISEKTFKRLIEWWYWSSSSIDRVIDWNQNYKNADRVGSRNDITDQITPDMIEILVDPGTWEQRVKISQPTNPVS